MIPQQTRGSLAESPLCMFVSDREPLPSRLCLAPADPAGHGAEDAQTLSYTRRGSFTLLLPKVYLPASSCHSGSCRRKARVTALCMVLKAEVASRREGDSNAQETPSPSHPHTARLPKHSSARSVHPCQNQTHTQHLHTQTLQVYVC